MSSNMDTQVVPSRTDRVLNSSKTDELPELNPLRLVSPTKYKTQYKTSSLRHCLVMIMMLVIASDACWPFCCRETLRDNDSIEFLRDWWKTKTAKHKCEDACCMMDEKGIKLFGKYFGYKDCCVKYFLDLRNHIDSGGESTHQKFDFDLTNVVIRYAMNSVRHAPLLCDECCQKVAHKIPSSEWILEPYYETYKCASSFVDLARKAITELSLVDRVGFKADENFWDIPMIVKMSEKIKYEGVKYLVNQMYEHSNDKLTKQLAEEYKEHLKSEEDWQWFIDDVRDNFMITSDSESGNSTTEEKKTKRRLLERLELRNSKRHY